MASPGDLDRDLVVGRQRRHLGAWASRPSSRPISTRGMHAQLWSWDYDPGDGWVRGVDGIPARQGRDPARVRPEGIGIADAYQTWGHSGGAWSWGERATIITPDGETWGELSFRRLLDRGCGCWAGSCRRVRVGLSNVEHTGDVSGRDRGCRHPSPGAGGTRRTTSIAGWPSSTADICPGSGWERRAVSDLWCRTGTLAADGRIG